MKCFMFDLLKRYVKDDLTPAESKQMEQHVEVCPQCQRQLMEWVESMQEEDFSAIPEAPVPDTFTDEVMDKLSDSVPPRFARKHSSRTRRQRGWDIVKKTALVVAGLTALVVTGTVVSPTFANYVNSLFQIEKVADNGIKNAVNKGFVQQLEKKATDQGITIEAKEVMADSMRIAVIYDMYDQNGKQISKDEHFLDAHLIDPKGKDWLENGGPSTGAYGKHFIAELALNDIFESSEATPDQLTLKLEQTEIAGKKGKWSLEIPIDMKKAKEATRTVTFQDKTFQSPLGFAIELEKMEFSPSATRVMLETTLAKSAFVEVEEERVEFDLNNPQDKGVQTTVKSLNPIFSGDAIVFDITNEKGDILAAWDKPLLDEGITKEKNVLTLSGITGVPQGDYGMKWWHTFGPIQGEQKLKLNLQKIYEKRLASAKVELVPAELAQKPAKLTDGKGSSYTFSAFSIVPGNNEHPGGAALNVQGKLGKDIVEADYWTVTDENGQKYPARLSTKSMRDKDGRVQMSGKLNIIGMDKQPAKLTVSYREYTVEHAVEWEVPIEIK